jgi:hypothetical protein
MNRNWISRLAACAFITVLAGCNQEPNGPAAPPVTTVTPAPAAGPAAKKPEEPKKLDIAGAKLDDKQIAEIKKLKSEDDQKLALEQKLCPITGAKLGQMGTPIKVMLKDKPVFLCCSDCEEDAKAKPDEALAKLGR